MAELSGLGKARDMITESFFELEEYINSNSDLFDDANNKHLQMVLKRQLKGIQKLNAEFKRLFGTTHL